MEFLNNLFNQIPGGENTVIAGIAAAIEIAMRLLKTEQPKSLLLVVSGVFKMVAKIAEKLASLVDALIPQRLK